MTAAERQNFAPEAPAGMTLPDILVRARMEIQAVSDLPVDSLARSERDQDGSWLVVLELLESAARMGDNDLLCAYEMRLDPSGQLIGITRIGRYYREAGFSG